MGVQTKRSSGWFIYDTLPPPDFHRFKVGRFSKGFQRMAQPAREHASWIAWHSRGSVAVESPATLIRPVPTM